MTVYCVAGVAPRFSALRLFVTRVYRRFRFPAESPPPPPQKKASLIPHLLLKTKRPNSPNAPAIIREAERRRAASSNDPVTYFTDSRFHSGEVVVFTQNAWIESCLREELVIKYLSHRLTVK